MFSSIISCISRLNRSKERNTLGLIPKEIQLQIKVFQPLSPGSIIWYIKMINFTFPFSHLMQDKNYVPQKRHKEQRCTLGWQEVRDVSNSLHMT